MKFIYRVLILTAVFAASIFYFGSHMKETKFDFTTKSTQMSKCTLPTVSIVTGGCSINMLHGYCTNLESSLLRENITPVSSDDMSFTLDITENEYEIKKVNFEVFSTLNSESIEEGSVISLDDADNGKSARIVLSGAYDNDTEYAVKITLITSGSKRIYYYTRIKILKNSHLTEKLDYIEKFHEATFDKEKAQGLSTYLETDRHAQETDLSAVTINSSVDMVSYMTLAPSEVYRSIPAVTECTDDTVSAVLNSVISVDTGNGISYYNVTEEYRFLYTSARCYLYDYNRSMEEIFDINNTSIAKSEFKLGITSCTDVGSMVSDDKTHAAFVRNGSLYSYSVDDNKLTEVFTFDEEKTDYIRDCYNKHDIKILSMDATGFMYFMVYGYMNRGEYEGRVAIILYTYDPATSLIEEKAYIPLDTTYDILKEQLSDFAYCNSREVFYFGLYDTIYSYDIVAKTLSTVAGPLHDNEYVYSSDNGYVAYNGDNCIYMLNLETDKQTMVKAGNGKLISILGICSNNIIYGYGYDSDICTYEDGTRVNAYYEVDISDCDGIIKKKYEQNGNFITGVAVDNNIITMTVAKKSNMIRGLKVTGEDHIINNDDEEDSGLKVTYRTTDKMLTEYYLSLPDDVYIAEIPKLAETRNKIITEDTGVRLTVPDYYGNYYLSYAFGNVCVMSEEAGNAVISADKMTGSAIDALGNVIWSRGETASKASLTLNDKENSNEKSSLQAAAGMLLKYRGVVSPAAYDSKVQTVIEYLDSFAKGSSIKLTGISVKESLYYVSEGCPVIAVNSEGRAVLIYAYGTTLISVYDPAYGESSSYTYKKFEEYLGDSDWYFVTFIN